MSSLRPASVLESESGISRNEPDFALSNNLLVMEARENPFGLSSLSRSIRG
jgi:hypothetical protein